MKATDLDKKFDVGEDITKHLDLSKAPPRARAEARQCGLSCVDDCPAGQGSQATGCAQAILDQDADRSSP